MPDRYFAMTDTEGCTLIEGATTFEEAAEKVDSSMSNVHWIFNEEGLREFIASAQEELSR